AGGCLDMRLRAATVAVLVLAALAAVAHAQQRLIDGTPGGDCTAAGGADLVGGDSRDVLNGGLGADCISGEGNNDVISGDPGDDVRLDGGPGRDEIAGDAGSDQIEGGPGRDLITG